jgi:mannose-1-phosphate guanylyltransferase
VAFGIEAERPETGYGYLQRGEALDGGYRVATFVEKPDAATAERFLADGEHSWNGGIFALRAGTYLEELERQRPALAQAVREAVVQGREDGRRFHPDAAAFARIEAESIDYAVMEETDHAAMVPVSMGWSDIGDWRALHGAHGPDDAGNVANGPAELIDCRNVMVVSDGPRVSVVGLEDVVVVVDGGEVLVTTHAGAQKVGKLAGAKGK